MILPGLYSPTLLEKEGDVKLHDLLAGGSDVQAAGEGPLSGVIGVESADQTNKNSLIRFSIAYYDFVMFRNLIIACLTLLASPSIAERQNVLMIVVDDMNDWVGCLNRDPRHPIAKTPNIDRLASRGQLFTNAHCAAPVCNPSRVAVMTGRRPGETGIYDNGVLWHQALPGITTIPGHFKANGYQVVGGGKIYHHMPGFNRHQDWHSYFDQVFDDPYHRRLSRGMDASRFRWPDGFPLNGLPSVKSLSRPPKNPREFDWGAMKRSDSEMGDGQMVRWATEFLKQPHESPFFLAAGIYRPHLPFYAPPEYFKKYEPDSIPLPPVKRDDLEDLPNSGKAMASTRRGDLQLVMQTGKFRELLHAYLASMSFADAMVGRLLDALDESGQADNTIIVLWSDHGWHFGEKQHLHKFTLWERSTHVPLIIVAPEMTQPRAQCDQPVGLVDLFPTLLDLCELPDVDDLSGHNLTPLLRNPTQKWNHPALTSHGPGNHTIRTTRWRYIRYSDGGEELYDHQDDPNEWFNVANRPDLASLKKRLVGWLPDSDAKPLRKRRKKTPTK